MHTKKKAEYRSKGILPKPGMTMPTLFAKIVRGELPADIIYQDDLVTAFRDINPQAPTHVLVIPNKAIRTANDLMAEDEQIAGRMLLVAKKVAEQEGIAEDGYRLIINCNRHGGQEVYHLHLHVIGGRRLGPMLMRS
jgi:histidine triad (HIT) family protein